VRRQASHVPDRLARALGPGLRDSGASDQRPVGLTETCDTTPTRRRCEPGAFFQARSAHSGPGLLRQLDHSLDLLHRRLDAETDEALGRRMHFPVDWDRFFRDEMTLLQVYAYGSKHYDFHRSQLTIARRSGAPADGRPARPT
jgi:hypothetical protein